MNDSDKQFGGTQLGDAQFGDTASGDTQSGFSSGARQRALDAYDRSRDSVSQASRRVEENIDEAPLIALAGGIAAGALLAALLPRTEAETRAFRPIGQRVRTSARAAASAAKEASTSRIADLGFNKEKGGEVLRSIFQDVSQAAKDSAKSSLNQSKNNA